ncbi:MAG: PEP-CTERM sorting domain-containing protein [Candidatus Binataceae bacterium]
MRSAKMKAVVAALSICACGAAVSPASATPFVDIRASWSARLDPLYPSAAGIALSCSGDAVGGATGCGGNLSLNTTVTTSQHLSAAFSGGIVLTNTTTDYVGGYVYLATGFSAFNPGGPGVGLSIDDPLTQGARFTSSVGGAGVGDFHSCSIGVYGQSGSVFSPTTCGVSSPDSSQSHAYFDVSTLAPGSSLNVPYSIMIDYDFTVSPAEPPADSGVPEPASAAVLLAGLVGLRLRKRR